MKKSFIAGLALVFALVTITVSFAATKTTKATKAVYKAGDEVYVCGCGEKCPCQTMSKKPGKCTCGKDLVKTTITKVEKGKAYAMVNGKELAFSTTGKYACACGPDCKCDTISQSPGKCACGKDMKKVQTKK